MKNQFRYQLILSLLVGGFMCYNFWIYTQTSCFGTVHLSQKALAGERLWQQYNCNSCHQLYGLGGYLGPDLTNIYSQQGKGAPQIKAMLNSGVKAMPLFHFSETEKEALVAFLKEVDQTGQYPNRGAVVESNGWVSIKTNTP
ncbi:c-type cytochrome [Flavobacterium sp. XGLA_31]|uniref:c-type cytochrome n=1 Tax=Flavobacterium sp. XGLA_31 TaxID=3447666 RepID=UPI003F32A9CA